MWILIKISMLVKIFFNKLVGIVCFNLVLKLVVNIEVVIMFMLVGK